jgi:hypothetical protein
MASAPAGLEVVPASTPLSPQAAKSASNKATGNVPLVRSRASGFIGPPRVPRGILVPAEDPIKIAPNLVGSGRAGAEGLAIGTMASEWSFFRQTLYALIADLTAPRR